MFEKLPDVLGKEFLTSFFAPMALFVGVHALILIRLDIVPGVFVGLDLTGCLLVISIIAWVGGLILNGINREIYRFLEGYGALNPLRVFSPIEHFIYGRLMADIDRLDASYREAVAAGHTLSAKETKRRNALYMQRAWRFPIHEDLVLPTPFGNRLRAFESYVNEMYGADSIALWTHLTSVIDDGFAVNITAVKNIADFWVNTSILSITLFVEMILLSTVFPSFWFSISIVALLMFTLFAYYRAQTNAVQWGRYFRAAFDIYLPQLWKKLGYPAPKDRKTEKKFWELYSQATTYRQAHLLDSLELLIKEQAIAEKADIVTDVVPTALQEAIDIETTEGVQGYLEAEESVIRWSVANQNR